jgi:uncharacterized iron-regulated membrane protein
MSSILKALKKLEDEKNSGQQRELRIDTEILRSRNAHNQYSLSRLAAVALLVALGGSGATYLYMKRDNNAIVSSNPGAPLVKPVAAIVPTAEKAALPSEKKTDDSRAQQTVVPSVHGQDSPPATRPPVTPRVSTPALKKSTIAGSKTTVNTPDRVNTSDGAVVPSKAATPLLRVNGIAFQSSSADSMAIINGTPAAAGTVLSGGVRIEEIQRDRVIFERNGEKFDIRLGQANQP